jgi:hypothetical protein
MITSEGPSMPHQRLAAAAIAALLVASSAAAQVERYKTEATYLARLAELGLEVVGEGFEGAAWDDARSPTILDRAMLPDVTTQGVTWTPASKDLWGSAWSTRAHGVTTNHNWARSGDWGLFEDHQGEAYPTTIRIATDTPIYAVGGWFNTNPDLQSVGFLYPGATSANEPGYLLPGIGAMYPGDNPSVGHEFVGIVDPAGFTEVLLTGTLEVNEDGALEGGNIFGVDDVLLGVPPGFMPPSCAVDLNADGVVDGADLGALLGGWGGPGPSDLTGDGVTDGADLGVLLGAWGVCGPGAV